MADSVLAIQDGFDYQAKFFWLKACQLYRTGSTVAKVSWEKDGTPGFDDVALYYSPPKINGGDEIHQEYYQLKFHVDHGKAFTCDAIITPDFINATSESILTKLYKNYKADPKLYLKSLYHIINTWGIDRGDEIKNLLDNDGAIILKRLFDGTTDRSKYGKIRKAWREHLGITSDEELSEIVSRLRITHNARSGSAIDEDMNWALQSVGLQPLSDDKRTVPYTDLIYRLHGENRKEFDKDGLRVILTQENLWVTTTTADLPSQHRIGLRSFQSGTETIDFETDDLLSLLSHFEGRYVQDAELWQSHILPSIESFIKSSLLKGLPLVIHLDTHSSVAFTTGYLLHGKTGAQVSVVQKVRNGGRITFQLHSTTGSVSNEESWLHSEAIVNADGEDLVLAIGVTHDIQSQVKEFVTSGLSEKTSRILYSSILPNPSGSAIKDGQHAVRAVEQYITYVRSIRNAKERKGIIRLFIAAPNVFSFVLGQSSQVFGKLVLYEFDFDNMRDGSYQPAISLPINQ